MAATSSSPREIGLLELSDETRFRSTFDYLAIGTAITAPDGRWLRVNRALSELLGYTEDDLVGRTFQSLTHPEDLPENLALMRRALEGEIDRCHIEKRFLHAEGHTVWIQLTASVVRDPEGKAQYFVAQFEDLTGRRAAEAQLRESELRYRTVVETAHEGICRVDTVGRITYANQRMAHMLGYGMDELLGQPLFNFMERETAFAARTRFARRQLGIAEVFEIELLRKDGNTIWALKSANSLFDANGQFAGAVYLLTDVTERHAAERRLAESEHYFRALTEQSWELVCVLDADGVIRYANPGFSRVLGYGVEEVIGHKAFEFIHEDDLERIRELFASLVAGPRESIDTEYRVKAKAGGLCLLTGIARNLLEDPRVQGIVVNAQDVTERRRVREALQESQARFQHIVNNVPGMVYQWAYQPDGTGGYTYVSEGARTLFGIDPEAALRDPEKLLGLIPSPEREVLRARARDAASRLAPFQWEGRVILAAGEERIIQIAAHDHRQPDGTVLSDGLVMDITDQRELEQQLRQAHKLEAVGRLAGGIAHDFNNLLTVISSYTNLALEAVPPNSEMASELGQVRTAAERAAALTRQLLAFSRQQVLQPQRLDVGEAVTEVAHLLRRLIGEDISLRLELASVVWPVLADPGQLTQVLMNLSLNARDAMPNGGTLRLVTMNTSVRSREARERPGLTPGDYVEIRVEDTGIGIEATALPHIFEPFYTTKGLGHGTGLGLATVYGIVKQSEGFIYVDSVPGQGSRFTVLLPRAHACPDEDRVERPKVAGGTETVMLVEDDTAVRGAVKRMLLRLGYRVLEASGVTQALSVAADANARGAQVKLVLTDVVMPEQNGRALGEQLAALWPTVPVIYMSGYPDDEILRRGLRDSTAQFLGKPFTVDELASAVRAALDRTR